MMLSFDRSLPIMNLDVKRYTKTLDRVMGQIIREAAREWLRAILKAVPSRGGFPVLTGAAKSTLVPLGRLLNNIGNLSIHPTRPRDKRADHAWGQETHKISDRNFIYEFSWSSDLLHYYLNDIFGTPTVESSPWHSQDKGEQAFEDYVFKALETRVPDIEIDFEEGGFL